MFNIVTEKTCSVCGDTKELSSFYKWGAQCKKCRNSVSRKWIQNNRDKFNAIQKKHQDKYKKMNGEFRAVEWGRNNPEARKITKQRNKEKNKDNPRYFIQNKISYWKSKYPTVKSNIDVDYLFDLWSKQKGLCYYTNEVIFFGAIGKVSPNSASLDRLDPLQGYVKGNLVWCSFFVNTMKGSLKEEDFYKKMKTILNNKKYV